MGINPDFSPHLIFSVLSVSSVVTACSGFAGLGLGIVCFEAEHFP